MNISTILDHVERKIQDSSYSRSPDLLNFVNMGIGEIASEVVLPSLLTYDTVTCTPDGFTVDMPDDFYAHLRFAHNQTKDRRIRLYYNLSIFLERFAGLNRSGDVYAVCEHGGQLYYQCVPATDQDVRIWYAKEPTVFTEDNTDEADFLPKHLQGPLLINYAAMKVFEEIEDDGQPVNFEKYFNLYSKAKGTLITLVGLPDEGPEFVPNHGDHFGETLDLIDELGGI